MATFLFSLLFFLLVVAGMSIGVILNNKPIKGSCGGMGALGLDTSCDICGGDPNLCEDETRTASGVAEDLFYPAEKHS